MQKGVPMQHILGITGGTGCGKTTALHVLEAMGFHVIDCDALYHRLLETDTAMLAAIEAAFSGVLSEGVLQRKILGQRVFQDPNALDRLNRTVWPFVVQAAAAIVRSKAPQSCAIDAIGLLESGLSSLCTETVAITAPEEARVRRLMAREGISEDYARLRIRAQKSNEVFAAACGLTIENDCETVRLFADKCHTIFTTLFKEDQP